MVLEGMALDGGYGLGMYSPREGYGPGGGVEPWRWVWSWGDVCPMPLWEGTTPLL